MHESCSELSESEINREDAKEGRGKFNKKGNEETKHSTQKRGGGARHDSVRFKPHSNTGPGAIRARRRVAGLPKHKCPLQAIQIGKERNCRHVVLVRVRWELVLCLVSLCPGGSGVCPVEPCEPHPASRGITGKSFPACLGGPSGQVGRPAAARNLVA